MEERGYCSSREDLGGQSSRQALSSLTWGKGRKEKESMVQPTSVCGIKRPKSQKTNVRLEMSFSYSLSNIPKAFSGVWILLPEEPRNHERTLGQ